MTHIPKQTSFMALWGAMLAVALLFSIDLAQPGLSLAIASASVEAISESVDTQLAAVGAALEPLALADLREGSEIYKAPPAFSFEPFNPTDIEYFYNDNVIAALEVIEAGVI